MSRREFQLRMGLTPIEGASLFHYAGHSAFDTDARKSMILLDTAETESSSVTAAEIAERRMSPNALVVLSSCESAVGNSIVGTEIRGLTSAFLAAGAGSVVGTLWPVESVSTSELMMSFHEQLVYGRLSVAEALRKAQLSFLREVPDFSHPYYWSGFVVTGNSSALGETIH